MAVGIRAVRNNLPANEGSYYALASWSSLVRADSFIDKMAKGGTTLSKADIVAVFQLAREELTKLLADGCYVQTPLGAVMPRASGRFRSPTQRFEPFRRGSGHGLRFDFLLDPAIAREALTSLVCRREEDYDAISPAILSVESVQHRGEGFVQAGDLIELRGKRLKFRPEDEALGLFLKSESGALLRLGLCAQIQPSRVIAGIPADTPMGDYKLVVRTESRGRARLEGESSEVVKIAVPG